MFNSLLHKLEKHLNIKVVEQDFLDTATETITKQQELNDEMEQALDRVAKENRSLRGLISSKDEANGNLIRENQRLQKELNRAEDELFARVDSDVLEREVRRIAESLYVKADSHILMQHGSMESKTFPNGDVETIHGRVEIYEPVVFSFRFEPEVIFRAIGSERRYIYERSISEFCRNIESYLLNYIPEKY